MIIDLTSLSTNLQDEVVINKEIKFNDDYGKNTPIKELKDAFFNGKIIRISDDLFNLTGIIDGIMILPDDITLEDVEYHFSSQIEVNFGETVENDENNLEITQNTIDILPFLWQNIVVEIPSKVRGNANEDINLEGDGWRLINEDEVHASNNSPFSDLQKLLDDKEGSE